MYDQHGKLTPKLVVETARPKDHPLHAIIFDRDAPEAAESWYLHRAHEAIQSVKVIYRERSEDADEVRGRAFLAVKSDGPDNFVYEPVEKVVTDEFTRQLVLRDMEREWKTLYERYKHFDEFVALVNKDVAA